MTIKICGINSRDAYRAASDAGADVVGFVFFGRSPRYVSPEDAATIAADAGPARVGLFVEPDNADIDRALSILRLDALQVYASPDRARALRQAFGMPVWRSASVQGRRELPKVADGIDRLLMEPMAPAGADRPGGNAVTMDWGILRGWQAPVPWLLAGGLTPGNVGEAIRVSGAKGVDVSSGVETAPGVKSTRAIERFVAEARRALATDLQDTATGPAG